MSTIEVDNYLIQDGLLYHDNLGRTDIIVPEEADEIAPSFLTDKLNYNEYNEGLYLGTKLNPYKFFCCNKPGIRGLCGEEHCDLHPDTKCICSLGLSSRGLCSPVDLHLPVGLEILMDSALYNFSAVELHVPDTLRKCGKKLLGPHGYIRKVVAKPAVLMLFEKSIVMAEVERTFSQENFPSDTEQKEWLPLAKKYKKAMLDLFLKKNNTQGVCFLLKSDLLKKDEVEMLLETYQNKNDAEMIATLLTYQNNNVTKKVALSLDTKPAKKQKAKAAGDDTPVGKEWKYKVIDYMGGMTITGYSGDDKNIVIPALIKGETVKAIDESVFSTGLTRHSNGHGNGANQKKMKKIETVTIPDSVEIIGQYAFSGCPKLKSVNIPQNATVGNDAFFGCLKMQNDGEFLVQNGRLIAFITDNNRDRRETVELPKKITEIASNAFSSVGLTSVVIPEGVTKIGERAFAGCGLAKITIPASVTEIIEDKVFLGCNNLTIHAPAGSKAIEYATANNIKFVEE